MGLEDLSQAILQDLEEFAGHISQGDDISSIEMGFPRHLLRQPKLQGPVGMAQTGTLDSQFGISLRGKSLGNYDPIPRILQTLLECRELMPHKSRLFTIVSELYNNALEHGVLQLDSSIKHDSEGFSRYYQARNQRLRQLAEGFVRLEFDHKPLPDGGEIVFDLYDSGRGFDYDSLDGYRHDRYSGRGLPLVMTLCDSVEFLEGGRHVRAIYRWKSQEQDGNKASAISTGKKD